jgi:hypothetical protein
MGGRLDTPVQEVITKQSGAVSREIQRTQARPGEERPTKKAKSVVVGSRSRAGGLRVAPKPPGRYTSIFVSRLDPQTKGEEIIEELKNNGVNVDQLKFEKLKTKYDTYASFRIYGRCEDPDTLLKPEMWDEGVYIKWYKVKRNDQADVADTNGPT